MDIEYYMRIQNSYGTKSKRERDLAKVNQSMAKHFHDTFDTETVLINGRQRDLMIIRDTDNNTHIKRIKSVHEEPLNLGDYVDWNGQKWLVTLVDVDDKTWNRGTMYLCTVPLRWQNADGEIVERWAYSEDFTKYSSGVTEGKTITLGDNQYGLTLPIDDETRKLVRDMRFPIDFDNAEHPEIYKLTNRKVMLKNNLSFSRGGTMVITMTFSEFNKTTDKRVLMPNGNEVWICDYSPSSIPDNDGETIDEPSSITCTISGNDTLKIGFSRTYTALLADGNGADVKWTDAYNWNIIGDVALVSTENGDKITLLVEDDSMVQEKLKLQVCQDGEAISEMVISIVGMF